jgi:hypothetical protein
LVIPAGGEREVRLTLDLSDRKGVAKGLGPHRFEAAFLPSVDSPGARRWTGWTLTGSVKKAIQSEQAEIDFGRISELAQPVPSQAVTLRSLVGVAQIVASCSHAEFEATVRRSEKDASRFIVLVASKGNLGPGKFHFDVDAVPYGEKGEPLGKVRFPVSGLVVCDVEASPPNLLFGSAKVGAACDEVVTLRSLTGRSVKLREVRSEGEGLMAEPLPATGSPGVGLRVRLALRRAGQFCGKVVAVCEVSGRSTVECEIPVDGYGIADAQTPK